MPLIVPLVIGASALGGLFLVRETVETVGTETRKTVPWLLLLAAAVAGVYYVSRQR